jgi:antitoxin ChpS
MEIPTGADHWLPQRPVALYFAGVKLLSCDPMPCEVTLRRTGGSITLSTPKSIARAMAVDAGSVVELVVEGRTLSATPIKRTLADRLAASLRSPAHWGRDAGFLQDDPAGRELL